MFKRLIQLFAFCVLLLLTGNSNAAPLAVRWTSYSSPLPIERLVLYRSINGGDITPYIILRQLSSIAYTDRRVISTKTYCYELRAITTSDVMSPPSERVCARPK